MTTDNLYSGGGGASGSVVLGDSGSGSSKNEQSSDGYGDGSANGSSCNGSSGFGSSSGSGSSNGGHVRNNSRGTAGANLDQPGGDQQQRQMAAGTATAATAGPPVVVRAPPPPSPSPSLSTSITASTSLPSLPSFTQAQAYVDPGARHRAFQALRDSRIHSHMDVDGLAQLKHYQQRQQQQQEQRQQQQRQQQQQQQQQHEQQQREEQQRRYPYQLLQQNQQHHHSEDQLRGTVPAQHTVLSPLYHPRVQPATVSASTASDSFQQQQGFVVDYWDPAAASNFSGSMAATTGTTGTPWKGVASSNGGTSGPAPDAAAVTRPTQQRQHPAPPLPSPILSPLHAQQTSFGGSNSSSPRGGRAGEVHTRPPSASTLSPLSPTGSFAPGSGPVFAPPPSHIPPTTTISPTSSTAPLAPFQNPAPKHTRSISNTNLSYAGAPGAAGVENCNMTTIPVVGLAPGVPSSTPSQQFVPSVKGMDEDGRDTRADDGGSGSQHHSGPPHASAQVLQQQMSQAQVSQAASQHHASQQQQPGPQQAQQAEQAQQAQQNPFSPVTYFMDTAAQSSAGTACMSASGLQAPSHAAAAAPHSLDIAPLPESIEASIMGSSTWLLQPNSQHRAYLPLNQQQQQQLQQGQLNGEMSGLGDSSGHLGDAPSYSSHNYAHASSSNNNHHPHPSAGPSSSSQHFSPSSIISAPHNPNPLIGPTPFPPLTSPAPPAPDPLVIGPNQDFGSWRLAVDTTPFSSGLEGISGLPLEVYHATSAVGGAPPHPSFDMRRDPSSWGPGPVYEEEIKMLDTYLAELISLMEPFALTPQNPCPPPPPPYLHTRLARLATLVRETLASLESRVQPRLDVSFALAPPGDAKATEAEREMLQIRIRRKELQEKAIATKVTPIRTRVQSAPYPMGGRAPIPVRHDAWRCVGCGTTHSNVWCDGPDGPRSLCESCGDHYDRLLRKRDGGDGDFSSVPAPSNGMIGMGP